MHALLAAARAVCYNAQSIANLKLKALAEDMHVSAAWSKTFVHDVIGAVTALTWAQEPSPAPGTATGLAAAFECFLNRSSRFCQAPSSDATKESKQVRFMIVLPLASCVHELSWTISLIL
jgi:hypothetical protein